MNSRLAFSTEKSGGKTNNVENNNDNKLIISKVDYPMVCLMLV